MSAVEWVILIAVALVVISIFLRMRFIFRSRALTLTIFLFSLREYSVLADFLRRKGIAVQTKN